MNKRENKKFRFFPKAQGLYEPRNEHDSCGVGFIVNINGVKDHKIIENGITVLKNLLHRGAIGGDLLTGDGSGLLFQIPDIFLRKECRKLGITLPLAGEYGVGMIFLPPGNDSRKQCLQIIESVVASEGLGFLGWRDVPVNSKVIAGKASESQPVIMQCFINGSGITSSRLERRLYVVRKQIERKALEALSEEEMLYIPSMSCRTIVYKGLLTGTQLPEFYMDLNNPDLAAAMVVVHQRYSTNTFPSWELSQPFRYLAHNGEINTLRGNLNHMRSRENLFSSELFGNDIKKILPIIDERGSDSSCIDNALELLVNGGRSIAHAMLMVVPEAWGVKYPIGPDQRGFFEYHAGLMEPWDGPAFISFTDGNMIGAMLDRNGLRPARYTITKEGLMVCASEVGVLDFSPDEILEKGSLRPGQMILIDLEQNRVLKNGEIKSIYSRKQPYRRWVEENKITLRGFYGDVQSIKPDFDSLLFHQRLFGYTREDLQMIIEPMASTGQEPVGAMGADTPLAVLSEKTQLLYSYFKQLFAQVTNPPIDPVREELVMTLMTFIGNPGNILIEVPQNSRLIKLRHPILANEDLRRIIGLDIDGFKTFRLPMSFPAEGSWKSLDFSIDQLCKKSEEALHSGASLIILTDRDLPEDMAPIPALLAVSAVNSYLSKKGMRTSTGLIVETGEAREVMHIALLLGYGATAINPYIAFETVASMAIKGELKGHIDVAKAIENYINALCKGVLKVMSKMGISTLRSYRGAQVFEAIGLNGKIAEKYFPGTFSPIGGIGLEEIASEARQRYQDAHNKPKSDRILKSGGRYKYRVDGERHLWTPEAIINLQQATKKNDFGLYKAFSDRINNQLDTLFTLRGMFHFKKTKPIHIDEVEPSSKIIKRFVTGAMSFGALSREAHETIAIAMNRLGAMSNSGEGGEDAARYIPLPNGDNRSSAVKQVASGRFGVTAEYLVNAKEIQIKIAQGAKPGEGGQLPGHKVNEEIARVRHSTPGVILISPPPHHDIYSIEDLSQLIFDLKNVNPDARISVKLVSEVGVGTVAAGVAKAHADKVLISGYDGGTGASPLSSIQHAGSPWELGLADTQHTLVLNGLRSCIRLQVDGQMKTGRDVIMAALLGAEEYGFATAVLVVLGCVMMRKCNANFCPVGVATQDSRLRELFKGRPEHVINYFHMVAEEVREYMAQLGFRSMDDLIGRSDLIEKNNAIEFWKARGLDFSKVLYRPKMNKNVSYRCTENQRHNIVDIMDRELFSRAYSALKNGQRISIEIPIRNTNRAVGAMLSGQIAKRFGNRGLQPDTITIQFSGAAGQSFGAFGAHGLTFILEGEANDYVGKGLSGAKIIVKPYRGSDFNPSENVIAGNVILYGATSGELYISGKVGERFAIRNSGAYAVVEGVGDHGCEYMTGGRVVILGKTGVNFGAGMSGGIAYVYDPSQEFDSRCNLDMVDLELVTDEADVSELKGMIQKHFEYTGSKKAWEILNGWKTQLPNFIKVFPMEYRLVLGKMSKEDEATERQEAQHG